TYRPRMLAQNRPRRCGSKNETYQNRQNGFHNPSRVGQSSKVAAPSAFSKSLDGVLAAQVSRTCQALALLTPVLTRGPEPASARQPRAGKKRLSCSDDRP